MFNSDLKPQYNQMVTIKNKGKRNILSQIRDFN